MNLLSVVLKLKIEVEGLFCRIRHIEKFILNFYDYIYVMYIL